MTRKRVLAREDQSTMTIMIIMKSSFIQICAIPWPFRRILKTPGSQKILAESVSTHARNASVALTS